MTFVLIKEIEVHFLDESAEYGSCRHCKTVVDDERRGG